MRIAIIAAGVGLAGCMVGELDDPEVDTLAAAQPFSIDTVEPGGVIESGIPIHASAPSNGSRTYHLKLGGIAHGDKLDIKGVVAVSRCNSADLNKGGGAQEGDLHSPCERMPNRPNTTYDYAPHVEARLLFDGKPVTSWDGYACTELIHHCPIVIDAQLTGADLGIPAGKHGGGDLFVEVRAYGDTNAHWQPGDIVEFEGDCLGDDFGKCKGFEVTTDEQNTHDRKAATEGQLTVVRIPAGGAPHDATTESTLQAARVQILTGYYSQPGAPQQPRPVVVLRRAVNVAQLHAGTILQADTSFQIKDDPANAAVPYDFDHWVGAWIILTANPDDIYPTGAGSRWISPMTGKNCANDPCTKRMVGAVELGGDLPASGTMYVNVLAQAIQQGNGTTGAQYAKTYIDVLGGAKHELQLQCFGACKL